ncbi:hypothetical protein D3C78_1760110 [compost metagenome]
MPAPTKAASQPLNPEQMFSQLEALSAGLTALNQKLDSFAPYDPTQSSASSASHHGAPTHTNPYNLC